MDLSLFFYLLYFLLKPAKKIVWMTPEMKTYVDGLVKERKEKDYSMQFDKVLLLTVDTSITFKPLIITNQILILFLNQSYLIMKYRTQ